MSENRVTPKVFVGREIRLAREAKGLSRAKVAKMLIVSESLVTKWERGDLISVEEHLTRAKRPGSEPIRPGLLDILDIPGVVVRMINQLVLNDEGSEWNAWPIVEQESSALWTCQTIVVHGLLQTESYAKATLQGAFADHDLEEKLQARLNRQQILTRDDPVTYVALLHEGIFKNNVGGAEVMHEQLEHLERIAQLANVFVQVIPHGSPACASLVGGFVIASVSGEDRALADNQITGTLIKRTEDLAKLRRFFDAIRAESLGRRESLEMIREAKEKWRS
jgi:DNA-binding XRE family transcriptional regulator